MAVSEAKKKSNRRWDAENVKRISLCVRLDFADIIAGRAAALNKPVNRYIVDLIREDLARSQKNPDNPYDKWLLKP